MTSELTYRTLTGAVSVDIGTERILEILIAPYGARSMTGEQYAPGAFGDPAMIGPVPLKLETGDHHRGPVVGRSERFRETDLGLVGTFRVSTTANGDDALTLAADGALGASAGFVLTDIAEDRNGDPVIAAAELHEVTLTGTPAYPQAAVLSVRSTQEHNAMDTKPDTVDTVDPDTDTTPRGEYLTRSQVAELVTDAIDEYRADAAAAAAPATVESPRHRGFEYRSIGDLTRDVIAHARRSDPDATERLTAHIDRGVIDRAGTKIELRAFTGPATSLADGAGVTPDAYIPDLLELLREGRPTANLFASRELPQVGNNVELPRVTQGASVGYQATQNTTVESQNVTTDAPTFPKSTMAGGQGVSLQAQQWGNPSYLDEVIRDHIAAYAEFLDSETINGDGATPNATAYTGILNGATDVPVGGTGTIGDAIAAIGKAWAAVYAGSRRAPIAWVMNSATWGAFIGAVDTDNRPLVTVDAPSNPLGISDVSQISGTLRGVPVIVDENVPSNLGVGTNESPIILGSWRDALLFENMAAPAQVALTYPDVLTTDVSVYGFSTLAIRRPAAFAVLSGFITPA